MYSASDYGQKEEQMMKKFRLQRDDARTYFLSCIKPRLDRSYKLYMSYNGDRAKEIKQWQANIFIPYTHAVVETLMPRVLDARPEFTVQGRSEDDQLKAPKVQQLTDFTWEKAGMDGTSEDFVRSSMIYGTGYIQVSWKIDKRVHRFLGSKSLGDKKYKWVEKEETFYDAPFAECVDNYALWYDWHNIPRESKQYWFKRLVLSGDEIKRKYPAYDKNRLKLAFASGAGDLTDYAKVRNEIKQNYERTVRGADYQTGGLETEIYSSTTDEDLKMHEVFEWWRPFDDAYAVLVNDVPILKGGFMPIPYDFKQAPFIPVPFLKLPHEFEGIGLPLILENPQMMLNMIKNQRLDNATLSIHKMWIVNPLANIAKEQLVTRPFGIIYSPDPNGVREVEFGDIKESAYREEELLKEDMRYASGVDDFSMAAGGDASSATEVRHLRESTLERVRLFINHMGDGYSLLMRYWISMYRQFFTQEMVIRIVGEDGTEQFPLIEKDDLLGEFDFVASVIPSIAGKNDIDKKQGMDLFQLLINLPFVDPQKLTSKVLRSWNWNLESLKKKEEQQMPGADPMAAMMGQDPNAMAGMPGMPPVAPGGEMMPEEEMLPQLSSGEVPPEVIAQIGRGLPEEPAFAQAGMPIDLTQGSSLPPIAPNIPANPAGFNRGGKVNTNINVKAPNGPEAQLLNQAANLQS